MVTFILILLIAYGAAHVAALFGDLLGAIFLIGMVVAIMVS